MFIVVLPKLKMLFAGMKGRVKYLYRQKAKSLSQDSHEIYALDCSGWSRYALAKCTNGALVIPDGSQDQLAWAQKSGLHKLEKYADVAIAKDDPNRLFIAFLRVTEDRPVGHVWLVYMGRTMESHSKAGVDSRHWNSLALRGCIDCFELTATQ